MSYVISGIGTAAASAFTTSAPGGGLISSAYIAPPQSTKPGPGAIYYPVPAHQSTKPGPGAVYSPVPVAAPQQYTPAPAAPAAAFDWKPWAIGAVVLGGGLYLLFR